jgi:hypothetical protein
MIDSDITGNIAACCHELPQKQEMIDAHESDCACDCCRLLSESNCQDNLDQCEEAQQPSGGMKKMRSKLTPIMANCAVLLAILALSGLSARASNIRGADTIHINPAIDARTANATVGNVISEIKDDPAISAKDLIENTDIGPIDTDIVGVGGIEITNLDNQIGETVIDPQNTRVDVDEVILPIDSAEANYIQTSVDRDILPTIRN